MAKKKEYSKEDVDFIVEAIANEPETTFTFSEKMETISGDFGREDLNKMRDVVNMLVERVNNA